MYAPEEFLKQAAECERMAKFARNPTSKVTWSRMAERWLQCAERAKCQDSSARYSGPAKQSRRPAPAWAHL
jgi:hypothetical protein